MAKKKDPLKEKKQTMLAELESIKSLLDDELDKIPVLQETVVEQHGELKVTTIPDLVERALPSDTDTTAKPTVETSASIHPDEPISPQATAHQITGALPGQQSLFSDKNKHQTKDTQQKGSKAPQAISEQHFEDNPFLPKHIRQRLNGASALMDAQTPTLPNVMSNSNIYTEQMIDQVVAQYMPKIESELRRRLFKAMTPSVDNQKK